MRAKKVKGNTIQRTDIKKKGKTKTILLSLVMCLVVYGAMLLFAYSLLNDEKETQVLVAKTDIPTNTRITKSNAGEYLDIQYRKVSEIPSDYLQNADLFADNGYVNRSYVKNEVISARNVSTEESEYGDIKDPVKVTISFPTVDSAVGGELRSGDRINLYTVYNTGNGADGVVTLIKDNLLVEEAYNSNGEKVERSDTSTVVTMVSVIISKADEEEFNSIISKGSIRASLSLEEGN